MAKLHESYLAAMVTAGLVWHATLTTTGTCAPRRQAAGNINVNLVKPDKTGRESGGCRDGYKQMGTLAATWPARQPVPEKSPKPAFAQVSPLAFPGIRTIVA
jgi:hypothetical protein